MLEKAQCLLKWSEVVTFFLVCMWREVVPPPMHYLFYLLSFWVQHTLLFPEFCWGNPKKLYERFLQKGVFLGFFFFFSVDKVVKLQFTANFEFNVEFSNSFTRGGIGLSTNLDLFCYCTVTVIPWKHWKGWLKTVWNEKSNVTLFPQLWDIYCITLYKWLK